MKHNSPALKKLFFLGIAVASTKLSLILFAYFFSAETYNLFNQVYYTASMVILFGSLGFNIAITRIRLSIKLAAAAVLANVIVTYAILQIISAPFSSVYEIISVITYSFFISIGGIYTFQLLFSGNYKDYVLLTIYYSVLHLLIIPSVLYLHIDLFVILPVISFVWFAISYPKYLKQDGGSSGILKEFYQIGLSAFVINSAVSLGLAADKFIANHFLTSQTANAYTFAWGLVAPLFYIGNLVEKYLFSEDVSEKSSLLKKGFVISLIPVAVYSVAVLLVANLFPGLIPESVSYHSFIQIFSFMIPGYALYVIIHFPVNAYLFKAIQVKKQKQISIYFTSVIILALVIFYFVVNGFIPLNYEILIILVWLYMYILLFIKTIIIFNRSVDEPVQDPLMEKSEFTEII